MNHPFTHKHPWAAVARTGFFSALGWYAAFWVADLLRPGLVSRYLSVHWFLLAAIAFAVWWSVIESD